MMSTPVWFLLVGGLLLFMGLTTSHLKALPITSSIIYLLVGLVLGPSVLDVFHFNPLKYSALLEVLTEVAVLISLFAAGVKMPAPIHWRRWRTPVLLAMLSMSTSVMLIAGFAYALLGLPLGACVILGAILAPTDPVLATDVQIRHPGDQDELRFTLTCEAGMNDGTAFPFVMLGMGLLGLHDIGESGVRWLMLDVIWATFAGVAVGLAGGYLLGRQIGVVHNSQPRRQLLDDFLGLGLIGVVYGISLLVGGWGFLTVFFAAVALHQTELKVAGLIPVRGEELAVAAPGTEVPQLISEGSLVFKEHLERLSEVVLVLLVGGMLFIDSWSWPAVGLAIFLFVVARPLSVLLGMAGSGFPWRMRGLTSWFGVRGIGSLYYLMYVIQHGLPQHLAVELIQLTLVVITLSVLVHGASAKPLMRMFWRRRHAR